MTTPSTTNSTIAYLRVSSLRLSMKLMSETITSVPSVPSPSLARTGMRAMWTEPFGSRRIEPTVSMPASLTRVSDGPSAQPTAPGRLAERYAMRPSRLQNAIA